ncbi:hypothetical protein [Afipia birgiae]|jgi:hypothetical protein|uniref:hypothetical protein n=1 Tax=Afipia birgiae TaxID=151414 RepID=UPI0003147D35|nr:hypothetical protein [Afipia birgiae]
MTKHAASQTVTDAPSLAGVVLSGIGGSGKSTLTLTIADLAEVAGIDLDILQFDHQSKLGETLGRDIVTLDSAIARKSRSNPDAIVELFEPFTDRLASLKDTKRSLLIEIGGGLTPIFHDHNRLVDLNEDVVELGVNLTVFVVVLATPEAIGQATVELDRLKEILPDARVIVVENRWRGTVAEMLPFLDDPVRKRAKRMLADHPVIVMPRVEGASLRHAERVHARLIDIIDWDLATVMEKTGLKRGAARLMRGDVAAYLAAMESGLANVLPLLGSGGGQ